MNPSGPVVFRTGAFPCLALIVLWAVIYMAGLSRPALLDDADTVHAEAAREMLLRHDWVTLYANGVRYLEKAPLMYWGVATSYTLFGISEWSTRFPLMLGVLAMILSTYGLGRWALGERGRIRFRAGAGDRARTVSFYALSDSRRGRRFVVDPDVLAFSGVAGADREPARWTCWGLAAVCALNVLTKGLIGLVFPVGSDRALSAADGKFAALVKTAPGFRARWYFSRSLRLGIFWQRCEIPRRETCADFSGSTSSMSTSCVS